MMNVSLRKAELHINLVKVKERRLMILFVMMELKAVAQMKMYVICQLQCQLFPNHLIENGSIWKDHCLLHKEMHC